MVLLLVSMLVFGVLLIWGAVASNKRDKAAGVQGRFRDLAVTSTHLLAGSRTLPQQFPLAGVAARVEDSGQLSKRITATRVLTTGVIALAWRKRVDDRSVFLTIEGPGVAIVREVRLEKDKDAPAAARRFAAQVNAAARSSETVQQLAQTSVPPGPPGEVARNLMGLSKLYAKGDLTEDEFIAAKAQLLGGQNESQDTPPQAW